MGGWPGKIIIGLTGNIATGKSVVRKMLEHLGAYGIDADALTHRAITQGAPGYDQVVWQFGAWILDEDGQINRARLGKIVFNDPAALANLEAILHPLVRQGIDLLVRRARQKVIVIEAIKLLEGELRGVCDSIWVTHVDPEVQLARLIKKRKMSEADAWQRITAQTPQREKLAAANVVIKNSGSYEETWRQVNEAWQRTIPTSVLEPEPEPVILGEVSVMKARPRQADQIGAFVLQASQGKRRMTREDVMEAFGEKAFMLSLQGERVVGLMGWQVENLVARIDDVYIDGQARLEPVARALLSEVEDASRELQCEAALLFLPPTLAQKQDVWNRLGYEQRSIDELGVRAWQDAARESMAEGSLMYFHQLRKDRVLRPV